MSARDWFTDEAEFRQLCGDAQSQAKGEAAENFSAEMAQKANKYGLNTFLTDGQLKYLCKLADWIPPKKIGES